MGIDLYAEFRNIPGLENLVGKEVSVEVGIVFKRTCLEDGKSIKGKPNTRTYKSKLVDLGKHGIYLENTERNNNANPKDTMILHVDDSYVKVPMPNAKTYLPFLDAECVYNDKRQDVTYTGILSIKHNNNLVYKRESLC